MVSKMQEERTKLNECPHCRSVFVMWDENDREPFCFTCGWRPSIPISAGQAKSNFRKELDFWANLLESESGLERQDSLPVIRNLQASNVNELAARKGPGGRRQHG